MPTEADVFKDRNDSTIAAISAMQNKTEAINSPLLSLEESYSSIGNVLFILNITNMFYEWDDWETVNDCTKCFSSNTGGRRSRARHQCHMVYSCAPCCRGHTYSRWVTRVQWRPRRAVPSRGGWDR